MSNAGAEMPIRGKGHGGSRRYEVRGTRLGIEVDMHKCRTIDVGDGRDALVGVRANYPASRRRIEPSECVGYREYPARRVDPVFVTEFVVALGPFEGGGNLGRKEFHGAA
jgi:hypothetical protein